MLQRVRARLSWLAAAWLLVYASTGVLAAGALIAEECGCPGMGGQFCPMHHGADSTARCHVISSQNNPDVTLWSVFAGTGVVPSRTVSPVRPTGIRSVDVHPNALIDRPAVPDAPPPRL